MINTLTKKQATRTLLFSLFLGLSVSSFSSVAASTNVTINGNGYDNVLDKEQARQMKEDGIKNAISVIKSTNAKKLSLIK